MADLAIIVPTRSRPGNIANVLRAWDFTGAWDVADLVVAFDGDDPERDRYREVVQQSGVLELAIELPTWLPMVHKLDDVARRLSESYFALGFAGDDHLPRTIGWAAVYLDSLRQMRTGMVYGDDGYQGARLCTEWAMTSDVVRTLGRMVPAPVEHMYSDVSVLDLFRGARCARHLPQIRIEHMHPYAQGKAEMDDQYARVNSSDQMDRDKAIYQQWRRAEMVKQIRSIRGLGPVPQPSNATRSRSSRSVRSRPSRKVDTVTTSFKIPRRLLRIPGATPDDISMALADMAAQVPADQAIVELGVYRARTTLIMAFGASAGYGAHVWGIDPWELPGNTYGEPFKTTGSRNWARHWVRSQGYSNRVTLIQNFSAEAALWWNAEQDKPKIGLLFVDGDHSHEGATADILLWAPHLVEGATIAIDDYGHPDWPGVKQAVDDLVSDGTLEPIQIFHDRLAVTRLKERQIDSTQLLAVTSEGAAVALPLAVEGDLTQHEHPGTGQVTEEVAAAPDGVYYDLFSGTQTFSAPGAEQSGAAMQGETTPVGKGETVDLDPPPVPDGKADLVDLDPNVAVARETVLATEIPGLTGQTTLGELNGAQLRQLAKARNIPLGPGRRTEDWLRSVLRSGR